MVDAIVEWTVVSESVFVRGFTTAASWFGIDIAAFAWDDLSDAMSWLKLDPQTALAAMSAVKTHKFAVDQKLATRSRGSVRL